jgi:hypothetical protein
VMARVQALLSTILPLLLSALFFNKEVGALKAIFTPSDLIPILPHSVAWPLLNTLHNAVDLLPEFVGAVSSEDERLKWNGTCFLENEAYMEYTEPKKEGQEGGGILHIEVCNMNLSISRFYQTPTLTEKPFTKSSCSEPFSSSLNFSV